MYKSLVFGDECPNTSVHVVYLWGNWLSSDQSLFLLRAGM